MQLAFTFSACFLVFSLFAIGFGKAKISFRVLLVLSSQLEEDGADDGGLCARVSCVGNGSLLEDGADDGGLCARVSRVGSGSLLSQIHCR